MCLQPFLTDNLREMCTIARDYVNKKNATVPPPDFEELPRKNTATRRWNGLRIGLQKANCTSTAGADRSVPLPDDQPGRPKMFRIRSRVGVMKIQLGLTNYTAFYLLLQTASLFIIIIY